jgi:hypothetical protein
VASYLNIGVRQKMKKRKGIDMKAFGNLATIGDVDGGGEEWRYQTS